MEHLLQLKEMLAGVDVNECFNPYFYGTSTSTKRRWLGHYSPSRFQSLFLWNIYFNKRGENN